MLTNQQAAGARALGMLSTLVEFGHIPAGHLERARDIVAQYHAPPDAKWPELAPKEPAKVAA